MTFSEAEIDLIKNLSHLPAFKTYFENRPKMGDFFYARSAENAVAIDSARGIFFQQNSEKNPSESNQLWLPHFDDLLEIARAEKISFSQITDFIHRRRYADGREREGLLLLFFELKRSVRNR